MSSIMKLIVVLSPRLNCLKLNTIFINSLGPLLPRLLSTVVPEVDPDVYKATVGTEENSKKPLSQNILLTKEDFKGSSFLVKEGSPCVTRQLDVVRYSIKMAASCLMNGDDVADHYHFRYVYCKHFGITEALDNITGEDDKTLRQQNSRSESRASVSCSIQLSDENKTKITLPWLPSDLSEKAVHKIISYILSNKPYTFYVYNLGNSIRVLVNSDVSLSFKIPKYLELLNAENQETSFVRVFVQNIKKQSSQTGKVSLLELSDLKKYSV